MRKRQDAHASLNGEGSKGKEKREWQRVGFGVALEVSVAKSRLWGGVPGHYHHAMTKPFLLMRLVRRRKGGT